MEIFILDKKVDSFSIIEDYFFNFLENSDFENKFEFFIKNELVAKSKKNSFSILNLYNTLPFLMLNKILKSMENDEGEYILSNIYIPNEIW